MRKIVIMGGSFNPPPLPTNGCCRGVDAKTGQGQNHLGKILMKIREELKPESE